MIAIDTNVAVRFISRDDPAQVPRAVACIAEGVYVPDSVMMETEWVLRGSFGWPPGAVNAALREFISLEAVHVRDAEELLWALDRHAGGADLADMLHLLSVRTFSSFASFEKRLAQDAGPDTPVKIVQL